MILITECGLFSTLNVNVFRLPQTLMQLHVRKPQLVICHLTTQKVQSMSYFSYVKVEA